MSHLLREDRSLARIVVLGSAGAVADGAHGHTCLAIECASGLLLVDSGDSPIQRLQRTGLRIGDLQGVIITHFHPDHVATLPDLVLSAWLLGRATPLPIYGLRDATDRFAAMMRLFRSDQWPGFYALPCHPVPETPGACVLEHDDLRITSAPTRHTVPAIGLRIENRASGRVVAYSSDTEPCDEVVALARGASILFHEASGDTAGHSSPAQAGEIGRRAGAARLVLIHYPANPASRSGWVSAASDTFGGPVELALDYGQHEF